MPRPVPHPEAARRAAPGRRGRVCGVARAAPLLAGLVVALIASMGALALLASPASAATSCTAPAEAGRIRVVLVIDPGTSGPRAPQATCLVVAAGTSGAQILAQRASELGLPAPRYAANGLLCGIDGYPGSGCPVNTGGTYDYWAYFNGVGGTWSYGRDNPFVRRMVDGEIMGWRYSVGATDGAAATPRIAPSASLFPARASAPPPAPAPQPAPAPGPAPVAPGPSTGGGSSGSVGEAPTLGPDGAATPGEVSPPTGPGTEGDVGDPAEDQDEGATGTTSDADATTSSNGSSGEELAATPASSTSDDGASWIGPAVAGAAIVALGAGAVARSRLRSSP